MRHVYNIDPTGFGTNQAESLVSYDFRLANALCIPVHALNKHALVPLMDGHDDEVMNTSWYARAGSSMVTIGEISKAWAAALNLATGRNDLMSGTLNFACGFLATQNLLAKCARYCRECLRDALIANIEPWIPLLWFIGIVTACPIHRVKLRTRQCGAPENSIYPSLRKILPENCWTCGRLLCLCDKSRSVKATAEEVAIAELVGELIGLGTSGISLPSDALQLCNKSMPKVLGENWLVRAAEASQVHRSSVHRMFRQAGTRSSLPGLVRFCLCNHLSLAKMAMGEAEYRYCENPSVHRARRYHAANADLIRCEMQKSINAGGARSLRDLARKFHHCPKTLEAVAPDLVPALKLANAAFRTAERNISAAKQEEECRKIIETLTRKGLTLTLRNARELTGQSWHWNSNRAQVFLKMREQQLHS